MSSPGGTLIFLGLVCILVAACFKIVGGVLDVQSLIVVAVLLVIIGLIRRTNTSWR